ncbi:dienelactone hydrolase family protein, partial [Tsukamurella pulmonis]|uniref:dienelactone hydrolase family protein n=1 Tax=Tsukamurella pulmonis TaxID=47312 RepID=UPI001A9E76E3
MKLREQSDLHSLYDYRAGLAPHTERLPGALLSAARAERGPLPHFRRYARAPPYFVADINSTDDERHSMPINHVQIQTTDGIADAIAAQPDNDKPHPAVLMYPDGFGIRPALTEMADRLASHGFYVLVPNVYYRHGRSPLVALPEYIDEESRPAVMAGVMPLIEAHTEHRVLRDAQVYLEFLGRQPTADAGAVAVLGYCIGGLYAVQTA